MHSTLLLKRELDDKPSGVYAPQYFQYLGYRKRLCAKKPEARANATEALFTRTVPYIYRNDWIVGSIRPLMVEADPVELEYAATICKSFGRRGFAHNADHFAPDYQRVVQLGVPGLLAAIEESMARHEEPARVEYLAAMRQTLLALRAMMLHYADAAERLKDCECYSPERLAEIAARCRWLASHPPASFADALQLVWFCHIGFCLEERYAMALGRIDQYLYPFYQADVAAGRLTPQRAQELLENTFIKIYERRVCLGDDDVVNICIGGTSPDGSNDGNALSYIVLRAVKECQIPGPNLSARIAANTPDGFLDECLQVIGTGLGYPALMNDEVNIAALKRCGYADEDVYAYCMVGCIENFLPGKQPPWSDGRFDTPRFFEFLFNRGKGIHHPSVGIDTGPVETIETMEEFMRRFEAQLEYGAEEYFALFNNENCRYNPAEYVQPFLSCFCEDCIERGLDINAGGARYPSVHGAALMGVGTVCDSLAAVDKVVFCDRAATLSELADALRANFAGYEALREKLLAAPKYGNNDPFVDRYAVWFVDFLYGLFSRYRTHDGGRIYIAMAANTSNIWAGREIAATPDGRLAGEPLSDAASPTYGRDRHGVTEVVNSVTKPDYTKVACGTVVNQKFTPSAFEGKNRDKLRALLRVYFRKGGQEMQINSTSREVLLDAMEHPEQYQSLVVRVSGFSAFFVTLDRSVQLDILSRTQQE